MINEAAGVIVEGEPAFPDCPHRWCQKESKRVLSNETYLALLRLADDGCPHVLDLEDCVIACEHCPFVR